MADATLVYSKPEDQANWGEPGWQWREIELSDRTVLHHGLRRQAEKLAARLAGGGTFEIRELDDAPADWQSRERYLELG